MKILVTGTPGSGKTSLVNYAKGLGNERFVDADEVKGLCEWRAFKTGKVVGLVDELTVASNDDWYKAHGWYWRVDRLKDFLATNPNAVLCGSSENIADCYGLFDKIIILRKTKRELHQNLQSPNRTNPFGKTTKQRSGFMKWQNYLIKEARPYRPIFIDGNATSKAYHTVTREI